MSRLGFSPRSANLALYVGGFPEYEALLAKLQKLQGLPLSRQAGRRGPRRLEEIARRTYAATEDFDRCPVC